jgi:hypothetical protein
MTTVRARLTFAHLLTGCLAMAAVAAAETPYAPAKVVYDVSAADPGALNHVLDRISMLQNLYAADPFSASIVVVLHEGAIPLFARSNRARYAELMQRADGLTGGEIIQFRLCRASARMQGFSDSDFDKFVAMVPMADAEIAQLQHEGYAYLMAGAR